MYSQIYQRKDQKESLVKTFPNTDAVEKMKSMAASNLSSDTGTKKENETSYDFQTLLMILTLLFSESQSTSFLSLIAALLI